ncbi:HAD family hydrolase [Carboxylicivirga taeanensis]|uniref:HAD family hydrolase n=1 Tax=Carboxylicivirga taeanensis TaxID=1416875 RepID=UPI003F6E2EF8
MKHLLATDLDGTILEHKGTFNSADLEVLNQLGDEGAIRVVATGRTLQSALSVLWADFPIDYLVFSSGAGIYCWKEKRILQTRHLGYQRAKQLVAVFQKHHVEYTLHYPIPENHLFFHPEGDGKHPDFERYLQFNQAHAELINGLVPEMDYTQTLAFMPDMSVFQAIEAQVQDVKVVRATSPIDGCSIWMECFDKEVSKANGILDVCRLENIDEAKVAVVGNDYNDLDMLNRFANAFVVANAPQELKQQYTQLCSVVNAPLNDWKLRFSF